jgi:hypothetical protein
MGWYWAYGALLLDFSFFRAWAVESDMVRAVSDGIGIQSDWRSQMSRSFESISLSLSFELVDTMMRFLQNDVIIAFVMSHAVKRTHALLLGYRIP